MFIYLELSDLAVAPRDGPQLEDLPGTPREGYLLIISTSTFICKVEIIPCSAEAS